jgi:hypothetical protein
MGATAAVAGVGVASGMGSAYLQAESLKMQGEYQKSMFEMNAKMSSFQAEDAERRGRLEAKEYGKKIKATIGSQRASLAAQGIDVNSGTALDIQEDTAATGAIDQMTIKNNAYREAFGYKMQAMSDTFQGKYTALATKNAVRNTYIAGGLNAVNSGASAGMKAYGG